MGMSRADAERCGLGHLFPAQPKRRAAHQRFVPNQTERRYAAEVLEPLRILGEIEGYEFETETLVLGPRLVYTPDYVVRLEHELRRYVEVKGAYVRDDSVVKLKAAAVLYPYHEFVLARYRPARIVRGKCIAAGWSVRRVGG